MSGRAFVDTNILMYAHDVSSGDKNERAKTIVAELWRSRQGVLSTQVLQELCVNLRRKAGRPLSVKATRDLVSDYMAWRVIANDQQAILEALDLAERHRVGFWDALIIHAAQVAGVDVLYSEDLSDGQVYGSVKVVNPLK